jgi:hypothetical protein
MEFEQSVVAQRYLQEKLSSGNHFSDYVSQSIGCVQVDLV